MQMLEALLAPGAGLELIRAVGTILRIAGRDWNTPPKSHAVAEAIRKIVAVLSHEPENSFPNREIDATPLYRAALSELTGWIRRHQPEQIREATDDSYTLGKPAGKMP